MIPIFGIVETNSHPVNIVHIKFSNCYSTLIFSISGTTCFSSAFL